MKALALSFLLTILTIQASAQETAMSASLDNGTSSAKRVGKNTMLTAQIGGMGTTYDGNTPATYLMGGSAGFFLNSDLILSVDLQSFVGGNGYVFDSNRVTEKSLGVSLKKFAGNSFYVSGGLDARRVQYEQTKETWLIFSTDQKSTMSFEGNLLSANLALGNQWQFTGFTLGCDWIGVSLPLSSQITKSTVAGDVSASAQTDYDNAQEALLHKINYRVARLYLGASF